MNRSRKGDKKIIFQVIIIVTIVVLIASLIAIIMNAKENIGLLPLIFICLSIYSFFTFFYYLIYMYKIGFNEKKKLTIKFSLIIFLIINVILSYFSIIVLWT